jgi:glutamyl-Q tRNA(Asp) synthetase
VGYVGRFAPTPSGELHLGSLYTAAASYLDARALGGRWLVRMEDLDGPRVAPGAADSILNTLESFGFEWDGAILRQSERADHYTAALAQLRDRGLTFECACSRAQLAEEDRYPGHCRNGARGAPPTATRLRVEPQNLEFADRIQGRFRQDLSKAVGDFILRRRDGIFAYVLAVIVDDAAQGVTDVVRGADLLDSTPRQIHLQRLLALPTPRYAHLPVLLEPNGQKLAKSQRSIGLNTKAVVEQLLHTFRLLNLDPPVDLQAASADEAWRWAITEWRAENVPRRLSRPL